MASGVRRWRAVAARAVVLALLPWGSAAPALAGTAATVPAFPSERFAPVQASSAPGAAALVAIRDDDGRPVLRFASAPAELTDAAVVMVGVPGGEVVRVEGGGAVPPLREGAGVWAMAGDTQLSAVFDASALLGRPSGAERFIPGNRWGAVARAGVAQLGAVDTGVASPTLRMENRALVIESTQRPPETIAGEAVVSVDDFVRLMPSEREAAGGTDFIRVDRTAGRIQLLETAGGGLVDVTGDGSWVTQGLAADDPTAVGEVAFDLPATAARVGQRAGPAELAVSVDRRYGLADGRVVTVYGVAATVGWLTDTGSARSSTTVASPSLAGAAGTGSGGSANAGSGVVVGAVIAAVVLAAIAVLLVVRSHRSRRRGRSPDEALAALDAQLEQLKGGGSGQRRDTAPS
jgi:hypothetical protein